CQGDLQPLIPATSGSVAQHVVMFRLRFLERDIPKWAARYRYPGEADIEDRVAPAARARHCLLREEFLAICRWKTPRSGPRCAQNRAGFVEAVTRVALNASDEELKIRSLLLLSGVSWPTASVILHFCDCGQYPILDYRALWSLSVEKPRTYTYELWAMYRDFVRTMA